MDFMIMELGQIAYILKTSTQKKERIDIYIKNNWRNVSVNLIIQYFCYLGIQDGTLSGILGTSPTPMILGGIGFSGSSLVRFFENISPVGVSNDSR